MRKNAWSIVILCLWTAILSAQSSRIAPEDANEARLNRLQPPGQVMDIIGAAAGMTIAEIGAGQGRYVVHLADRVGPGGRIYAEDIDADALRHLAGRCRHAGFANVEVVLGDPDDPKLPAGKLDLIFVISSYHHFDDPVALMRKAGMALKPTGRLAIAEWIPTKDNGGAGTAPEKMRIQMEEAGFILERVDGSLEANGLNIYLFRPGAR
jgi:ubiquinone/menaquinone biosynthesis C-methylase UbiE